jgi:hypothetical protein
MPFPLNPALLDLGNRALGHGGIAGVVDDDGHAVRGETFGRLEADAPRAAGHDSDPVAGPGVGGGHR